MVCLIVLQPLHDLPRPLLGEVMRGAHAVALLLGVMTQELAHVPFAKEFVPVAKEGMHEVTVVGGDVLLDPTVVGGIGADYLVGHVNLGQLVGGIPAGVDDDAGHAVQGERDEATERTADDEVYPVLADIIEYLLAGLHKVGLRVGERLHRVALGHKAFQ